MRSLQVSAIIVCLSAWAAAGVTVSSPTSGSTVSTSVAVKSSSTSSSSITRTIVYIDNQNAYSVASGAVSTTLTVATGSHNMVVQSWDSSGNVLKSGTITFTASSSSGIPSNATHYSNIDQMTGWDSCDSCAGWGGSGPTATHTLTQNLSSPSLDGKSAKFYLAGSTPYVAALWWKQLGANANVSNFSYDLYFYLKNPTAPQALEFDVNQSLNGQKYIFGTQCDIKGHHDWDVYDAADHKWVQTGIACTTPAAYTWNHLTLEFQRANGLVKFVAVTVNGKKSYINKSYSPASSSAKELNVAVQLDSDGSYTPYSEWTDKINLTAW